MRRFEIIKEWENKQINLPIRKTKYSAGYDIESAENIVLYPFKPTLIKTGLKVYMQPDEVLLLYNRSSNPLKGLVLSNGVGVIDKDYYNNKSNEGHIMFSFINITNTNIIINKGDVIGQAIFQKYLIVDNDISIGERLGGFGSTDKK